ncbi:MAG TPA: biopolymer transporter ExbD [Gammaproteobacteria bacterium]|nr:biopolymer transporter ExbD [Gammaproteobacteria bacterium]
MRPSLQERLEEDHASSINLAPMLDTVFNLLIFFIITSAFIHESGIQVEKPQAVTADRLKNDFIVLAITPAGEVWYDRNNIGVAGVRSTVQALLLAQERPVVIQADKHATTDVLVRVMDEAKLAGAKSLNIATAVDQ